MWAGLLIHNPCSDVKLSIGVTGNLINVYKEKRGHFATLLQ
ncbi:Hypothetical protein ABZS17G119_00861 [Kosakonia cowanii]